MNEKPASAHADHLSLLLADEQHRTANEISSALAGLHLSGRSDRSDLLGTTIARLEGYELSRRILARAEVWGCEPAADLAALFDAMRRGRTGIAEIDFLTGPRRTVLAPRIGGALLRCAHEMVTNALKHSRQGAPVRVALRMSPRLVELGTINEIATDPEAPGSGSGHRILSGICGRHGGTYERIAIDGAYYARVRLPRSPRPDAPAPGA